MSPDLTSEASLDMFKTERFAVSALSRVRVTVHVHERMLGALAVQ